jgi:hypothetical protein
MYKETIMDRRICVLLILVAPVATLADEFHIVGLSAELALNEFSRQAGVQLLYDYRLVSGMSIHDVEGNMSPDEALRMMLEGAGLTYAMINDHTISVISGTRRPAMVDPDTLKVWMDRFVNVAVSYPYENIEHVSRLKMVMPLDYSSATQARR